MILLGSNHYLSAGSTNTHSIDLESSSSQYLSITDASLSSGFLGKSSTGHTGDFTIEGWFNFESVGASRLFGKYATSQKCFYSVYSTNLIYFGISADKTSDFDKTWSWTPTISTWYHLAFVYDASAGSVEFFVNGISQGTQTGYATALQQTTAPFQIGDYNIGSAYFDGLIDEFRVWNDIRTDAEILANFNKQLVGNEANLQGYWQLNNSANDLTSNANDLTETNSPVYSTDVAFLSDALNTHSIDLEASSSQYLSITDAAQTWLDITGDCTFEAWVNLESLPSTPNGDYIIVGKWGASGQRSYLMWLNNTDDKLHFIYSSNGGSTTTYYTMDSAFVSGDLGTWYHLACVVDVSAASVTFYKNGIASAGTMVGNSATSISNGTSDFTIGNSATGSNYFDGLIDDVRVWNDIRTATEIANNYNKQLVGNEAGLVAYYQFNNNANDLTSNNNDLTENNSPTYSTTVPF